MGATILTIIISLSVLCFAFGMVAVIFMVKFDRMSANLALSKKSEEEARREVDRVTLTLIDGNPIIESLRQNPRYLGDAEWEKIQATVNKVYDGYCNRLLACGLTSGNVRVAVLEKLQFSTQDSSVILGISPASFTKAKQRLHGRYSR